MTAPGNLKDCFCGSGTWVRADVPFEIETSKSVLQLSCCLDIVDIAGLRFLVFVLFSYVRKRRSGTKGFVVAVS